MATPIPPNRAAFSLDEIVAATGGRLIAGHADTHAVSVSTDTRAIAAGALFVALTGASFDGHDHVTAAALSGAQIVLVERDVEAPNGIAVVRVDSTLDALGLLARAHLRAWRASGSNRSVVGITGSAGKTTTRVAATALLEALFPSEVLSTIGNLNNRVGLPMIAFLAEPQHRIALFEMGMNQPGEIAALVKIAEPDAGVVTLVAEAHTELLGSLDAVAEEKGALTRALAVDGVAIGNADDARVRSEIARSPARRKVLFGRAEDADVRIERRELTSIESSRVTLQRKGGEVAFSTPLVGEAGALACAAAFGIAETVFGARVSGELATAAFAAADVGAGAGRLLPRLLSDGLAVIDDSYNANPASMRASIRAAAEMAEATSRRLVLVLGEMRELGADSDALHDEIGRLAATCGAAALVAISGRARVIAEAARREGLWAEFREDLHGATDLVVRTIESSDLVLIKASRGVGLERIVAVLAEVHDAPTTTRRSLSSRPDPEGST